MKTLGIFRGLGMEIIPRSRRLLQRRPSRTLVNKWKIDAPIPVSIFFHWMLWGDAGLCHPWVSCLQGIEGRRHEWPSSESGAKHHSERLLPESVANELGWGCKVWEMASKLPGKNALPIGSQLRLSNRAGAPWRAVLWKWRWICQGHYAILCVLCGWTLPWFDVPTGFCPLETLWSLPVVWFKVLLETMSTHNVLEPLP